MQVVVLGAGSLGSLYAAWSVDAGHEVCIVARPAHADAVNAQGLEIRSVDGTRRRVAIDAVDDAADAPDADVVLLASKANDSNGLLDRYSGCATAAWSIQNGAHQWRALVDRFGGAAVGCSSMVGATLLEPGTIAHTFTGSTYVGSLPTSSPASIATVVGSLGLAAAVIVRDDIGPVVWSKAVLACGAMGVSVLLRLPYHHVFTEPDARELMYDIVSDAATVATAEGVELIDLPGPLQAGSLMRLERLEALERLRQVGEQMVTEGQTSVRVSMLQSLQTGRRLESQAVFGDLVDIADRHGLDVPLLRAVNRVVTTLDHIAATRDLRDGTDERTSS
jgi:2-dehydropantoate 2-reductase